MKKILHLTLKKKWFRLIAEGKKKYEYRECKPYWEKRLLHTLYDEIHFRNGYSKTSPFMRVDCLGIVSMAAKKCTPKHSEKLVGNVFVIKLGKVLEVA